MNWLRAFVAALVAEIAQIAAAFGWVALYSYLINPGQSAETYSAYALQASPWVSVLAGAPIFYLASRWIARSARTGLLMFAMFFVIDGGILLAAGGVDAAGLAIVALSFATKLVACWLGGRHAETAARAGVSA